MNKSISKSSIPHRQSSNNDNNAVVIKPFDWQAAIAQAIVSSLDKHGSRVLAVVPVAGGKSVIISCVIASLLSRNPEFKIIVLSRSGIISRHNRHALKCVAPLILAGVLFGREKHCEPNVIFGTAQSMFDRLDLVKAVDLVIIDECDEAFNKHAKQYSSILSAAQSYIGVTGTPFRLHKNRTVPIFGSKEPFDPPCAFIRKRICATPGAFILLKALSPPGFSI
jgi:superfamily II DNA or RNA helicase